MNATTDRPAPADLERLERALNAQPFQRTELDVALHRIIVLLRKHARDLDRAGGLLDEEGRIARPSLAREAEHLREELSILTAKAAAIQDESASSAEWVAADEKIRSRGLALLAALRQLRDDEADVVLESTTTDIGAGD